MRRSNCLHIFLSGLIEEFCLNTLYSHWVYIPQDKKSWVSCIQIFLNLCTIGFKSLKDKSNLASIHLYSQNKDQKSGLSLKFALRPQSWNQTRSSLALFRKKYTQHFCSFQLAQPVQERMRQDSLFKLHFGPKP